MNKPGWLLFFIFLLGACAQQPQETTTSKSAMPTPGEMRADITVKGRVSRLEHVDIQYLGKRIPYTYSSNKIGNSQGYDWWVSKHFALKSDLPEEKVRLYLELLELSYPHYVALFGAKPPNIQRQRIAVVYGSSRERVRESMLDDGFGRGVHTHAGGETMYYNRAGYNFPSHRLHHQRYIVIHETMHAFHMALTGHSTWAPNWITEGLADAIAHHVYDSATKELSVMVFDRAPMNYVELGLKQYQQAGNPSIEEINDDPQLKRGLNFLIIHFLLNHPQRAQYFALFRDRLMRANPHSGATLPTANRLLKQTFDDWPALEAQFARFVATIQPSFNIVSGPWEQDGNAYWIRSNKDERAAQMTILPPHLRDQVSHPVMDFPLPPPSPLINTDSLQTLPGLLIDFIPEQLGRGEVGLALGIEGHGKNSDEQGNHTAQTTVQEQQKLTMMLQHGRYLAITANGLPEAYAAWALQPELLNSITGHHQLGMTLQLKDKSLNITLTAGDAVQQIDYPLSETSMQLVRKGHIALLAKNTQHRLTPYFSRRQKNQQTAEGLVNIWGYPKMPQLRRLFNTCQRHPTLIDNCRHKTEAILSKLSDGSHSSTAEAQSLLFSAYLATGQDELLQDLSGIDMQVAYHRQQPFLRVENPADTELRLGGTVAWTNSEGEQVCSETVEHLLPGGTHNIDFPVCNGSTHITINLKRNWQNLQDHFTKTYAVAPFDGVYLDADVSQDDRNLNIRTRLTGPYSGDSNGQISFEVFPTSAVLNSRQQRKVSFSPYDQLEVEQSFVLTPGYHGPVAIQVQAEVEVDGEALILRKHL
jgi:hypothetical protein